MLHLFFLLLLGYFALELGFYWAALWAARSRRGKVLLPAWQPINHYPIFAFLTACRNGADCVPGLAGTIRSQDYPDPGRRMYLVADNCTDKTAEVARAEGFQVMERHDPETSGKGNAVSDMLYQVLRLHPFDVLVVLDVDARLDPAFLQHAAAYFQTEDAAAVSCATFAKNGNESLYSRVGEMIQTLLRLHQQGRKALGADAALYGSHGYALSRSALERLGWRTTTGQIAEDMELRLRCSLQGIPVRYADDLPVWNDVTSDAASAREQRRRWNSTYLPMLPRYSGPLLREALHGNRKCLEAFFGLLWLPSFANLFLFLSAALIAFTIASAFNPVYSVLAMITGALWIADVAYFVVAFHTENVHLGRRELRGFAAHLRIRLVALVESLFFVHVKDWAPAPHPPSKREI
jgi:cellulose synthase/poly-beta-1,6-N-acetylglucosamine synthase-like glycosyltransferase